MARAKEVPILTGIRGLAAVLVFVSHAMNECYQGKYFGDGGGQLGVMLFFILSGYLMSMLYLERLPSRASAYKFLINRFSRIYPMFFVVVMANYAIARFCPTISHYSINNTSDLIEHLLFIKGYSVLWTIGPEVIFYGLFVGLWWLRPKGDIYFYVGIAVLVMASTLPGGNDISNSFASLHNRVPYFIAGMLLATKHPSLKEASSKLSLLARFILAAASAMAIVICMPRIMAVGSPNMLNAVLKHSVNVWSEPFYLVAMVFTLVALIVANPTILTNRAAIFMGNISFSFYLLHALVISFTYHTFPEHPGSVIALSFLAAVALSATTYALIEKPSRRFLRSLFKENRSDNTLKADGTASA